MKEEFGIDAITETGTVETLSLYRPINVVSSKVLELEVANEPQVPSSAELETREVEKTFITGEQRQQTTERYGLNGNTVAENEPYFAKRIVTKNSDGSESVKYTLALYNGSIFNPGGSFSRRNQRLKDFFTFKSCNEACFNDYVQFLKTNLEQLYWKANRSILNG